MDALSFKVGVIFKANPPYSECSENLILIYKIPTAACYIIQNEAEVLMKSFSQLRMVEENLVIHLT